MTTAFTVVEPTSIPMRKFLSMGVDLVKTGRARGTPSHLIRFGAFGGHARGDVVHEVRGSADYALFVGDLIERASGFGMGVHPGAALLQRERGLFQGRGEFLLGLVLGFAERHLHAA